MRASGRVAGVGPGIVNGQGICDRSLKGSYRIRRNLPTIVRSHDHLPLKEVVYWFSFFLMQ